MRRTWSGLVLGMLFGFTVTAGVQADEEKVALGDLPKPVVDAVKRRFPSAEMKSAEKENESGKTVYEVVITFKGQTIEVTATAGGTITEIEKQVDAKRLPEVVVQALDAKYPKAQIKKVEEVFKVKDAREKLEYYEVLLVTAGKKTLEVAVTPAGKFAHEEDKGKD